MPAASPFPAFLTEFGLPIMRLRGEIADLDLLIRRNYSAERAEAYLLKCAELDRLQSQARDRATTLGLPPAVIGL